MTAVPIHRVLHDGTVEELGEWRDDSRTLSLVREGFPLLGAGEHVLAHLPWPFWDMCPSGFLGRRFAPSLPALALPADPRLWTAADCLRVLANAGADLAGNLLIGDDSVRRFREWRHDPREVGVLLEEVLASAMVSDAPSSLGGERPKLLGSTADGRGYLLKFSPPLWTPQGQRWSDLLHTEAHCARVLSKHGVRSVRAIAGSTRGRTTLHVERFDRLRGRGRVGACTLQWLAVDRWGDAALPAPEVVARLANEGVLQGEAAETCARVHAFSAAIGNNDAHLGNYGLVFDERGQASLAPIYDVTPMVFAPRHDELPDAHVTPAPAADARVRDWVADLAAFVRADESISDDFRTLWLRHVGLL